MQTPRADYHFRRPSWRGLIRWRSPENARPPKLPTAVQRESSLTILGNRLGLIRWEADEDSIAHYRKPTKQETDVSVR